MAERTPVSVADLVSNLETAAKIARMLSDKYLTLEAGELNTKFNELVSLINNTKVEVSEFQNIISGKNRQIADLESALKFKDKLVCIGDAYFEMDEKGKPTGHANCVKCWENTYKKRKLVVKTDDTNIKICATCGQTYSRAETENIKKKKFRFFG
jgi:murein L,D-transpeptidase YafK